MKIFRYTHLDVIEKRIVSTPSEFLDLYLEPRDITDLVDPSRRYTMDRFTGCTERGDIPGWAGTDKVHIRLDKPVTSEQTHKLAELSLDPGGDLYFTIWDGAPLRSANADEEFTDMGTFVNADPGEKLRHVGIEIIRLHQLSDLALALASN